MKSRKGWALRSYTPWIVCKFEGGKSAECLRCGEVLRLGLPMNLEVWCAAVRAFCRVHAKCEDPQS